MAYLTNQLFGQPTATETINNAALSGAQQDKEQYEQQQLSQYARQELLPGLLDAKKRYEAANLAMQSVQDDNARALLQNEMNAASEDAGLLRGIAEKVGINLGGYGSDVSYQQANANLAANDAKAINDMLGIDLNSDQYWNQTYRELREAGLSDRRAKREANRRAADYQAERMVKLNNVYNTYGRNANGANNEIGVQMLAKMAYESPNVDGAALANFYSNQFPGVKDEYNVQNQIAAELRNQQYKADDRVNNYYWSNLSADAALGRNKELAAYNNELRNNNWQMQQDYINAQRQNQVQQMIDTFGQYADALGLSGDLRTQFIQQNILNSLYGGKSGGSKSKVEDPAERQYKLSLNAMKRLEKQYEGDPEELANNKEYQRHRSIVARYEMPDSQMANEEIPEFNEDRNNNVKVLQQIVNFVLDSGGSKEEAERVARQHAADSELTDHYVDGLMRDVNF